MDRIKDVISLDNGIYQAIRDLVPDDYTDLFGEIEPADLDLEFLSQWGERLCSPIFAYAGNDVHTVARLIINRYMDNWKKIKEAMSLTYDVLNPATNGYTITKTGKTSTEDSRNGEDTNRVYGFNADNGRDESTRLNSQSGETVVDNVSTTTYNKWGVGNLTPNRLIEAEINYRRLSFFNIVMNDIKEYSTLFIY